MIKSCNNNLRELDILASKFILGHKKMTTKQVGIINSIEELKKEDKKLSNRIQRIRNLIDIVYKDCWEDKEE